MGKTEETGERETKMAYEKTTGQIIEAAMKVHTALGPGLLESAYETCLLFELNRHGLKTLRLSKKKVGLLINFNVEHLRDGLKRMVNN